MNRLPGIALAFFIFFAPSAVEASSGDLDPLFGTGGFVLSAAREFNSFPPSKPVLQRDGKILICETWNTEVWLYDRWSPADFLIRRFNTDGSLDSSFGVDGKAVVDFDGGRDECHDLTIQDDGKIVVAGTSFPPSMQSAQFAIARLSANGTIDTTFGGDTGKVSLQLGTAAGFSHAKRVQRLPDGKLLVAGDVTTLPINDTDFAVARLLPDGRLDATFGSNGKATTAFIFNSGGVEPFRDAYLSALSLDATGSILLGGLAFGGDTPEGLHVAGNYYGHGFAVARLTPNGQPDTSFANDGRTVVRFDGGSSAVSDIAVQQDGRLVLAGEVVIPLYGGNARSNIAVARLLPNGALDPAFGIGGRTVAAFDMVYGDYDGAGGVLIHPDGSILVAGNSANRPATIRLRYDGTLDTSFGVGGKIEYALPSFMDSAELNHVTMVAGHIYASGGADLSLSIPGSTTPGSYVSFVVRLEDEPMFPQHSRRVRPVPLLSPSPRSTNPQR